MKIRILITTIFLLFLSLIPCSTVNAVDCSCAVGIEMVFMGSTVNEAYVGGLGDPPAHCITGTETLELTGMMVPAGAMIFVIVHEYSATVDTSAGGTLSDGVNTYAKGTPINNNNETLKGTGMYFYALNTQALTNQSITYTKASTDSIVSMSAFYATGIATSNALDTAVTATSYGQTIATTPIFTLTSGTPTQSGELFIAFMTFKQPTGQYQYLDTAHGWGEQELTVTSGCGVTANSMNAAMIGGAQINTGTTAKTFSPTMSTAGGTGTVNWAAWILGFKHQ